MTDHHSDEHEDDHDDHDDHHEFEMDTTYYVVAWIKTLSFLLIVIPFVIYCLWTMWKDRNETYVKKRRPIIILILIIFNLFIDFRMFYIINKNSIYFYMYIPQTQISETEYMYYLQIIMYCISCISCI